MTIQRLFFDLDGTLTDSSEGIFNSILYAVRKLGYREPDLTELTSYVGPPLLDSFQKNYQLDEADGEQAVAAYREYYRETGITELTVYDGIEATLAALSQKYELYVATSKPEVFAKQILKTIKLDQYFQGIYGANLEGDRSKKGDIIRYGVAQLPEATGESIMVGDRSHDIIGGKENQMKTIGVLYGFGSQAELVEAGADWIVVTPQEILEIVK